MAWGLTPDLYDSADSGLTETDFDRRKDRKWQKLRGI
jgi:hypothetical protein